MQIALNSVRTLIFRVLYVALGWTLSVLTARWLGPQGNGLFTLATIYGTIGTTLMSGGVAAVAYEISNKRRDSRSAAANVGVLSLATGLFPVIVVLAAWPLLAAHGWWWLLPVALAQPAALLSAALVGVFLGTDDIKRLNYAYVGPWAATLLAFVILASLFGRTVQVALFAMAVPHPLAAARSGRRYDLTSQDADRLRRPSRNGESRQLPQLPYGRPDGGSIPGTARTRHLCGRRPSG
jgi:O-antigen/teichoic acid export membrane protein